MGDSSQEALRVISKLFFDALKYLLAAIKWMYNKAKESLTKSKEEESSKSQLSSSKTEKNQENSKNKLKTIEKDDAKKSYATMKPFNPKTAAEQSTWFKFNELQAEAKKVGIEISDAHINNNDEFIIDIKFTNDFKTLSQKVKDQSIENFKKRLDDIQQSLGKANMSLKMNDAIERAMKREKEKKQDLSISSLSANKKRIQPTM